MLLMTGHHVLCKREIHYYRIKPKGGGLNFEVRIQLYLIHCSSPRAQHCTQYITRVFQGEGQEKVKCKIKVYWHHRTSLSSPRMGSTSHTFICSPCTQIWRAYYVKALFRGLEIQSEQNKSPCLGGEKQTINYTGYEVVASTMEKNSVKGEK